jgi:hypothetical protein
MNNLLDRCAPQHLPVPALKAMGALLLVASTLSIAGPGAHGPNGEHLDGPATTRAASALPRVEAQTETFELVATLQAGELSVLIDRYDSNEPVLNARLEVESGGVKAKATFHADQGDYAVDNPKLLALLRTPGEHGLVFTLTAGKDSDLLNGTLVTAGRSTATPAKNGGGHAHGDDDHGHDHLLERAAWIGGGVAALGLIGGVAWWRQRSRPRDALQGRV